MRNWAYKMLAIVVLGAGCSSLSDESANSAPDSTPNISMPTETEKALDIPTLGDATVIGSGVEDAPPLSPLAVSPGSPPFTVGFKPTGDFDPNAELESTGSGSGTNLGYATVDTTNADRSVTFFYTTGGTDESRSPDDQVEAIDGTFWTVRTLRIDRPAVVAFSHPLDGRGAILFTGLEANEWRSFLEAQPTADPTKPGFRWTSNDKAVSEPDRLPGDLVGAWAGGATENEQFNLFSSSGDFQISVTTGASPTIIDQLVSTTSAMSRKDSADFQKWECYDTEGSVLCARISEPSFGQSQSRLELTMWKNGTTIAVTTALDPEELPLKTPAISEKLDELAAVVSMLTFTPSGATNGNS